MFYIIIVAVLFFTVGYIVWYAIFSKEDEVSFNYSVEVPQSELSDPKVNIPPYWFYAPHYRLLESISYFSWFWTPEFTWWQINNWEKSWDKRASELAKMWFLSVKSEKTFRGKRNYYSLNSKGKEAILLYNSKFLYDKK